MMLRSASRKSYAPDQGSRATVSHEATLRRTADALLGSMDAAAYEHVVLGAVPHDEAGPQRLRGVS